jgi:hypothetical protein
VIRQLPLAQTEYRPDAPAVVERKERLRRDFDEFLTYGFSDPPPA